MKTNPLAGKPADASLLVDVAAGRAGQHGSAGSLQNNLQMVSFCETKKGPHRTISWETLKAEARTNPLQRFFGRYFVISSMGALKLKSSATINSHATDSSAL